MSKLSELLNPAPTSDAPELATASPQSNHDVQPSHRDNSPAMAAQRTSPPQIPPLDSPLQALAAAPTNIAPVRSSTSPQATSFSSLGPYQSHASSRPTSSRLSPPLPLEVARQPEHPLPAISPGLEQYHHSTSRAAKPRGPSDIASDASQTLPPMRSVLRDENSPVGIPSLDEMSHVKPDSLSPEGHREEPKQELHNIHRVKAKSPPLSKQTQSITHAPEEQSTEVEVKAESIDQSSGLLQDTVQHGEPIVSTRSSLQPDTTMEHTLHRSISDLKIEARQSSQETSKTPKPTPSRKRSAPKAKMEKKGTASTVKPPPKRRKIDAGSVDGTPSVQRSVTPVSSRASKTPAPRNRKQESVTPVRSSSVAPNDEEEDEDEELFCICRKPDDHTWMIACDGGCEDWFHGRCVEMSERDGNLIDKYICPNCKANGVGQTTWKPMCRLETCRNPARVSGAKPSKYCSDEHGQEYMKSHVPKQEADEGRSMSSINRRRRRDNHTDNFGNGQEEDGDTPYDSTALRGGLLNTAELKAIACGVDDIAEFRQLGEGVLSPPRTVSPDDNDNAHKVFSYSATESQQLLEIVAEREALKARKGMLDDRDRFIGLVKGRAKRVLEDLRKRESVKDICGYDSRLSWSDNEFLAWRDSAEGQKALESELLMAPLPTSPTDIPADSHAVDGTDTVDGKRSPSEAPNNVEDAEDAEGDEIGRGMCQKRHCQRHRAWWKLQQQDVAFEKGEVRLGLGRLDVEEKGVKERAMVRSLEEG